VHAQAQAGICRHRCELGGLRLACIGAGRGGLEQATSGHAAAYVMPGWVGRTASTH